MNSQKEVNITRSWLNVNRACNLRCKWCYAEGTEYKPTDDMSLELAKKLVNFQAELGVQKVMLIGGEPTLWPHLFEIIELIAQKGMTSVLVTNGILLANEEYFKKLKASSIGSISFSIKSGNKEQHKEITGCEGFDEVMEAIRNTSKLDIPVNISVTINSLIMDNVEEIVCAAAENGAKSMSLEFCNATFNDGVPQKGYMPNPRKVAKMIEKNFKKMDSIMNGKLAIAQTLPFCLWTEGFLRELSVQGKAYSGCNIRNRDGLVFDQKGNVLICNCLYDFPIATFEKDFFDIKTFKKFWLSKEILHACNQICSYPSKECIDCNKFNLCGGGCPLFWFVNEPSNFIPA